VHPYNKYLSRYAEPEAQKLWEEPSRHSSIEFERCFILPIFNESIEGLESFLRLEFGKPLLSVWVFNCPEHASQAAIQSTQNSWAHFRAMLDPVSLSHNIDLAQVSDKHSLLLVDRSSEGQFIASKQGVGLARKIGADLALAVAGPVSKANFWMHFCDADVELPAGYFEALGSETEADKVAALYPFQHQPVTGFELATKLYDFKLQYYLEQLKWAGSPYAYHALGSTIAVRSKAYVQVRGVPKRSGGEDFYLLNKLAKLGDIQLLEQPKLLVQARNSDRVPFGTGPALSTISALENALDDYLFYHPTIFLCLKKLFQARDVIAKQDKEMSFLNQELMQLFEQVGADELGNTLAALNELGLHRFVEHCEKQGLLGTRASKAFDEWFDAFVTLRFVHIMRDRAYVSVPLSDLKSLGAHFPNILETMHENIIGEME
jgi:hypothetical protein